MMDKPSTHFNSSSPVGFLNRYADSWRNKWVYAVSGVGILLILIGGIGFGVFQPVLRYFVHKVRNIYIIANFMFLRKT